MTDQVIADENGLALTQRSELKTVRWAQIDEIYGFKNDLGVVDQICMAIESEGQLTRVNEDTGGWTEFVTGLHTHLTECTPFSEWFLEVALPPFETNPIRIYKRVERL